MQGNSIQHRRRQLLRAAGLTVAGIAAGTPGLALAARQQPRRVALHHIHTGEQLKLTYADETGYLTEALDELNRFLRDFRTGEVYPMATEVLDMLDLARAELKSDGMFEVISGYRSPATNEALRAQGRGVAKRSLHMQGRAMDVRLQGVPTSVLRQYFRQLALGGVGYYPRSDFVHVDNGRVRAW